MFKFLTRLRHKFFKKKSKAFRESNYGCMYGWFIERDGQRIGELDYLRWDISSQFWFDYRVTWRSPEDAVNGGSAWLDAKLVLRNRRYTDVIVDLFLASSEKPGGVIAIRSAYVPEERFLADGV
ncbi:hypothetical protein [Prosthecobacter sp.]|uniref:hypothetical protein n=1 Tax=Prosthecobacter sp. TaxID=1965333 RepID=UPI003785091F